MAPSAPVACVVSTHAIASAHRLAVAMMERLRPPESSATIMASERMPSSGSWKAIDWSARTLKS